MDYFLGPAFDPPNGVKCLSKKNNSFSRCRPNFGICVFLPGNTRPIWKRFFAFFNSSVGPLGSGHIKMSIIFNPGALKVTKSEFFDEKCVSFMSLCEAMGDLVEILISHGF